MRKLKKKNACCPACSISILRASEAKNVEIPCPECGTTYIVNISRYGVNVMQKKMAI